MIVEAETGTAGNLINNDDNSATMRFPSMDPEVGPTPVDDNLEDSNGRVGDNDIDGLAGGVVPAKTLPELSFGGEGGVRTHSKPRKGTITLENFSSHDASSYSNYLGGLKQHTPQ